MAFSALTTRGGGSARRPRRTARAVWRASARSIPASAGRDRDVESNGRAFRAFPPEDAKAAVDLAHLAAVAMKRKSILVRVGLAFALIFWVAAETARRLALTAKRASTAPVAVLLAGSFDVFNRTHCSFAAASSNRSARITPSSSSPPSTTPSTNNARGRVRRVGACSTTSPASRPSCASHRGEPIRTARKNTTSPPSSSSSSFVARPRCARDDVESSAAISHPGVVRLGAPLEPTRAIAASLEPAGASDGRRGRGRVRQGVGHDSHASRAGSDRHMAISRASLAFLRMLARRRGRRTGENTNAPPGRRSRGWCPRNLTWRSRTIFRRIGCARCPGEGACTRRGFTAAAG